MTTKNETQSPAKTSRNLVIVALLFVAAAFGTIISYKMRSTNTTAIVDAGSNAIAAKAATTVNAVTTQIAANATTSFSDKQKTDIESIIRAYLLKNPQLMLEVQTALDAQLQADAQKKAKAAVAENASSLYKRTDAPMAGKKDGDVTVVEFFDYNCGYCKRGLGELVKLMDSDKNVRVVFKELPILSKGSEEAARVALAAKMQNKYWDVHRALLEHRGQANKETALKIAEKLGLDMTKLKTDMDSDVVTKEITLVRQLADKMGVNGTPHFLVGDKSIPGAPDDLYEQLKANIADIRKNGCDVC